MKNHSDDVSQIPVMIATSPPPSTGSAQPGSPLIRSASSFVVSAPKKAQPSRPWTTTRVSVSRQPSDHRQW